MHRKLIGAAGSVAVLLASVAVVGRHARIHGKKGRQAS